MQAFVFTDKALEHYSRRFVWLSINTEEAKNAGFLAKYPIPAVPALLVLDSSGTKMVLRYLGSVTTPQLSRLLDDASRKTRTSADQILATADKFASDGNDEQAARLYQRALDNAPPGWPSGGRAAEGLIFALSRMKDKEGCAARAVALYSRFPATVSGANVAAMGLGCAVELDENTQRRAELLLRLEDYTRRALANPQLDLAGDDRSGLYMSLIDAREAAKDKDGTAKLKQEWAAFLERTAAQAKTAEQRAVYDPHRLNAYVDLGTPEKAIPMLQQSEKDFPDDYNPPARLAIAYRAMKNYDAALAASDRALARAYGPRKVQILRTRADIYIGKGDKASARKTLGDAIAYARQLPEPQQKAGTISELEKRLSALSSPGPP